MAGKNSSKTVAKDKTSNSVDSVDSKLVVDMESADKCVTCVDSRRSVIRVKRVEFDGLESLLNKIDIHSVYDIKQEVGAFGTTSYVVIYFEIVEVENA